MFLEMSRNIDHGGGDWGFRKCVWSPTLKSNGATWAYWSNILKIRRGDIVLHLRGTPPDAAFVGYSVASSDGFKTSNRPPNPGKAYNSKEFFRADLEDFNLFSSPIVLADVFQNRVVELQDYFDKNRRMLHEKRRIFYVRQAGRLQCLNGAYLSELDDKLLYALFGDLVQIDLKNNKQISNVTTSVALAQAMVRIGQQRFSQMIKKNYGYRCCYPGCKMDDRRFLVASHIARWSDDEALRGDSGNGLCLCVAHDRAFELGLFTLDNECVVRLFADRSNMAVMELLAPGEGRAITGKGTEISQDALRQHWIRNRLPLVS